MKTIHRLAVIGLLSVSQLACSAMRTVIADFDIDGAAKLVTEAGVEVPGSASKLVRVPPPAKRISPYPDLRYDGALFSTTLTINSDGVSGTIVNNAGTPLTFRFDQARVSSNVQSEPVALEVFGGQIKHTLVAVKPDGPRVIAVPMLSLQPGEKALLEFVPSYAKLYPSKRLFGVSFVGNSPEIAEAGVGNTLTLRVPVEHAGKRQIWLLELKAKETKVRSSYR
jgi:hypothetical protein